MPDEASKAVVRRMHTPGFVTRYFVGDGIDIGAGGDSLAQWHEQFPAMTSLKSFDGEEKARPDILGDAETMEGIEDESYDFVHSAHCLEHMHNPATALGHWWRILKPGGHLIVIVPDEDMYEQGVWPSTFNPDHKATFTTADLPTWSPVSLNVLYLVGRWLPNGRVIRIERLENTYRAWVTEQAGRIDQTASSVTEAAIEFVVRKGLAPEPLTEITHAEAAIRSVAEGLNVSEEQVRADLDDMPDPVEPDTDENHQADVDELEQFDREDE